MAAEPWWADDGDDWVDDGLLAWLDAFMRSTPGATVPDRLVDRLAAARPRWHSRAACKGSGVDFFDPAQVGAARALCVGCAVSGPCADYGRREPAGVWGGRPRGVQERPVVAAEPKKKRRRPKGLTVAACAACGEVRTLRGRGLCGRCYDSWRRRRSGVKPRRFGPTIAACSECGTTGPIRAVGRCARCYYRARRRAASRGVEKRFRLAAPEPFFLLDPAHLAGSARAASSIKGASKSARPVGLHELSPVDLVVAGCVAVGEDGARLGKGGGFSDLEFALASEAGLIGPETAVVTTVHELQVRPPGAIPASDHDVYVDFVITPDRVIACHRPRARSRGRPGLRWDELTDEKIAAIPLLARWRARRDV